MPLRRTPLPLLDLHYTSSTSLHSLSKAMEDFNVPSPERVALLERLQTAMGGAPPYFWAACQVCDLQALEKLVEHACTYPAAARIICWTMSQYVTIL